MKWTISDCGSTIEVMRHFLWISMSLLLSASIARAGQIEFKAGFTFPSQYSVSSLNASYDLTGLNLGINYLFQGSGDELTSSGDFSESQPFIFDYFNGLGLATYP